MTQKEAAAFLDCSQTTISESERGKSVPSERVVIEWDRKLDGGGLLIALFEDIVADNREQQLRREIQPATNTQEGVAPSYPIHGDASEWICDVTIPDGTMMRPMQKFTKIWRVRNAGTVPWIGRYLRRQASAGSVGVLHSPRTTPVPDTAPGETVDLTVDCRAQVLEGSSIAYFKFADAAGHLFFPDRYDVGVILEIHVRGTLAGQENL